MKIILSFALFLTGVSSFAQKPHQYHQGVPVNDAPVTQGGMWQGQENLKNQNSKTDDARSDRKFNINRLENRADKATANVSAEHKADLFNLGAELMPFVAPFINEIAKDCISKIDLQTRAAESKYAECAQQAISQFQKNPSAFIDRLPASEKEKLDNLVKLRTKQSIKPVNGGGGGPSPTNSQQMN